MELLREAGEEVLPLCTAPEGQLYGGILWEL